MILKKYSCNFFYSYRQIHSAQRLKQTYTTDRHRTKPDLISENIPHFISLSRLKVLQTAAESAVRSNPAATRYTAPPVPEIELRLAKLSKAGCRIHHTFFEIQHDLFRFSRPCNT